MGASITQLVEGLLEVDPRLHEEFAPLLRSARQLDRFYIPTRYPNGLPDVTPGELYEDEDAETCLEHAGKIVEKARNILGMKEQRKPNRISP